jgi:hypothetical protein
LYSKFQKIENDENLIVVDHVTYKYLEMVRYIDKNVKIVDSNTYLDDDDVAHIIVNSDKLHPLLKTNSNSYVVVEKTITYFVMQ